MAKVSYEKLWNLLEEKGYKKMDLYTKAKISTNALAKLGRDEDVRVNILVKVCSFLGCKLDDIVEMIEEYN